MEIFKIPGCDCNYITKCGKVYSDKRGKMRELKQTVQWQYLSVPVWIDGKSTRRHVHRLLALTFIPNPEGKEEVNHKDGDKLNNHLSNLEWVTKKENARHAQETGLSHHPIGVENGRAILTEDQVLVIYEQLLKGSLVTHVAKTYNVSPSTVMSIKKRKNWTHLLEGLPEIPVKVKGATVSDDTAREICSLIEQGVSPTPISEMVGVSVDVVYDIKRRRSYKHISKDFKW